MMKKKGRQKQSLPLEGGIKFAAIPAQRMVLSDKLDDFAVDPYFW
tara:strand:+ start:339 stop:473 length:135 start_codon:yes stop_codon:yes gene_type:complete